MKDMDYYTGQDLEQEFGLLRKELRERTSDKFKNLGVQVCLASYAFTEQKRLQDDY